MEVPIASFVAAVYALENDRWRPLDDGIARVGLFHDVKSSKCAFRVISQSALCVQVCA